MIPAGFVIGAALLLGACGAVPDDVPTAAGRATAGTTAGAAAPPDSVAAIQAAPAAVEPPPPLSPHPADASADGTAAELGTALRHLREQLVRQSEELAAARADTARQLQGYHAALAAAAERRLFATEDAPATDRTAVEAALGGIADAARSTDRLAVSLAEDAAAARDILQSAGVPGADEPERRHLALLQEDAARLAAYAERLADEAKRLAARQAAYVADERRQLAAVPEPAPAVTAAAPEAGAEAAAARRPLVVIRFDQPDVPYAQALYGVIAETLARRPEAQFDVVAVAARRPGDADIAAGQAEAQKLAGQVIDTLIQMGLPANRIGLAARATPRAATDEVHIYLR